MKHIRGKRALVTGAASGIGRAIALELARKGVNLFLWDIDRDRLEEVSAEIRSLGVDSRFSICDVGNSSAVTTSVREVLDTWGHIDILINNAGVIYYGPTDKMTADQWQWLLGINLLAPIQITRELLNVLLSRPEAHIVNVSSIAGLVAGGRFAAYHVSKFGLMGFSEALRAEYGSRGLGVTAICPGPVRTNLYTSAKNGKKHKPIPTPPRWLCTTEERVAAKTVQAIQRNKRMVLLTPLAHLLFNLKRFAPRLLDFFSLLRRKRHKPAKPTDALSSKPGFNCDSPKTPDLSIEADNNPNDSQAA